MKGFWQICSGKDKVYKPKYHVVVFGIGQKLYMKGIVQLHVSFESRFKWNRTHCFSSSQFNHHTNTIDLLGYLSPHNFDRGSNLYQRRGRVARSSKNWSGWSNSDKYSGGSFMLGGSSNYGGSCGRGPWDDGADNDCSNESKWKRTSNESEHRFSLSPFKPHTNTLFVRYSVLNRTQTALVKKDV